MDLNKIETELDDLLKQAQDHAQKNGLPNVPSSLKSPTEDLDVHAIPSPDLDDVPSLNEIPKQSSLSGEDALLESIENNDAHLKYHQKLVRIKDRLDAVKSAHSDLVAFEKLTDLLEKRHTQLSTLKDEVRQLFDSIKETLPSFKSELIDLEREWQANITKLDTMKDVVNHHDQAVKDYEKLVKIRDEITKRTSHLNAQETHLEKHHQSVLKQQDALKAQIKKSDEIHKNLLARQKALDSKENEIKKMHAQAVKQKEALSDFANKKKEIVQIKRQHSELSKSFKDLQTKYDSMKRELMLGEDKLRDLRQKHAGYEDHLKQKEEALVRKEQRLLDLQSNLETEQEQVDSVGFTRYMDKEMSKIMQGNSRFTESSYEYGPKHGEIYNLIGKAKLQLDSNNPSVAKQIYTQIQPLFEKIPDSDLEKKTIYYQLLELKTDIELNSLNH